MPIDSHHFAQQVLHGPQPFRRADFLPPALVEGFQPTEAEWPPRAAYTGDGASSHRIVEALTDAKTPLTLEGAFKHIAGKLDRPENHDLLNETVDLKKRIVARLEGQRAARRADLEQRHEEARRLARSWLEKTRAMRRDLNEEESLLNGKKNRASEARANFAGVRASAPRPEDFPTAAEIQEWRDAMARAETAMAAAEKIADDAELYRRTHAQDLLKALEEFQAAEQAEGVLRAQLAGEATVMLGVQIEPSDDE